MICTKCKIDKSLPLFSFLKTGKYKSICKSCSSDLAKAWNKKNKEKIKENRSEYTSNNREKINKAKRKYNIIYSKKKRLTDDNYRIGVDTRRKVNIAISSDGKCFSKSTQETLGCNIKFYKDYIKSMFKEGMNWENRGEWVIDHIMPLVSFNMVNIEEKLKAFHFTNTQPLWASENNKKGSKV